MFKAKNIIYKNLISRLGKISNKSILDYGCGSGEPIELLLESNRPNGIITAVDCDNEAFRQLKTTHSKFISNGRLVVKNCEHPLLLSDNYDVCFCHNVLECINDKVEFVNSLKDKLNSKGVLLLSHHDFDSAIYNSSNIKLTRELVHHFADTKQIWQKYSDGQMGRKLHGIFHHSKFEHFQCKTIRLEEHQYDEDSYGFHMSQWIANCAKNNYTEKQISSWLNDLEKSNKKVEYFFAIDIMVVKANQPSRVQPS